MQRISFCTLVLDEIKLFYRSVFIKMFNTITLREGWLEIVTQHPRLAKSQDLCLILEYCFSEVRCKDIVSMGSIWAWVNEQ